MKIKFLKQFFPYNCGIPSRSTISRVLSIFKAQSLESLLLEWAQMLKLKSNNIANQNVLSIDGKTACGVQGDIKMHLVNIYDTTNGLCLGQEKVDEKSNEITAIPKLLDLIEIKNQIVSIDAMGCQKEIAKKIISKGGDYFLALKGNQGDLFIAVKEYFKDQDFLRKCSTFSSHDKGHGRIETRTVYTGDAIKFLDKSWEWPKLKSIVSLTSKRIVKDKETIQTRYFITSLESNAQKMLSISRAHWSIENNLNWVLDVIFKEDERIIWNKNFAHNESIIRRIALNLLKQYRDLLPLFRGEKLAIKTIRKGLLFDDKAMFAILTGKI